MRRVRWEVHHVLENDPHAASNVVSKDTHHHFHPPLDQLSPI